MMLRFALALWLTVALMAGRATAQESIDASLNESVIRIKNSQLFPVELETTLFKPDGPGPFPVVVINHGKAPGDPRFQARSRPLVAVRFFLQRGYAVVAPMRQGFSKSGGSYIGGGCNVESNGRVQAEDVKAVLTHVLTQPWADPTQVLMVGQSHGGWTTLAFGALNYPGVKGLVNFAGGLRQEQCAAWERGLAAGAAAYGGATQLPSLWFYGDNDSYFSVDTFQAMHARYTAAGGRAKLVAFGKFGSDAHALFASSRGQAIWQPELEDYLQAAGLPYTPKAEFARFGAKPGLARPPETDFASIHEVSKVPGLREGGQRGYAAFLSQGAPRAFAISPTGAWGWASEGDDPLKRALDNCNRTGRGECRLYAVDESVVWMAIE